MKLPLMSFADGSQVGEIEGADSIFESPYNEHLVHEIITAYRTNGRSGNSKQLSRSEVSGGGKKPWRQKGTGQARAGTTRGPLWRKGGVTFASRPKFYNVKVNKKAFRKAMVSILAELKRQDRLIIVDEITLEEPKTKLLKDKLTALSLTKVVMVDLVPTVEIELAARNKHQVDILSVSSLSPVSLVKAEKVMLSKDALENIQEIWA